MFLILTAGRATDDKTTAAEVKPEKGKGRKGGVKVAKVTPDKAAVTGTGKHIFWVGFGLGRERP